MLARRSFLLGLTSALAAPAIVRAGSLMPVRAIVPVYTYTIRTRLPITTWREINQAPWLIHWAEMSDFVLPMKALAP